MAPKPATASARKSTKRSGASEIAPGVFVGGWNDAGDFDGVRICVLDEPPAEPIPGATHLPIYDEARDAVLVANLDRIATMVASAAAEQKPVLLFCGHGIRRGSLAAAWYLHRQDGVSLDDAYERVRAVRPKIETGAEWVGHWPPSEVPARPRR